MGKFSMPSVGGMLLIRSQVLGTVNLHVITFQQGNEIVMDKFSKSMIVNLFFSATFIIAGLYLAMNYFIETPDPQLHWEGIVPLAACLFYYIFS